MEDDSTLQQIQELLEFVKKPEVILNNPDKQTSS
jgi:hypothetical protein